MVRGANMGHPLAGGNSSWCSELDSQPSATPQGAGQKVRRLPANGLSCAAGWRPKSALSACCVQLGACWVQLGWNGRDAQRPQSRRGRAGREVGREEARDQQPDYMQRRVGRCEDLRESAYQHEHAGGRCVHGRYSLAVLAHPGDLVADGFRNRVEPETCQQHRCFHPTAKTPRCKLVLCRHLFSGENNGRQRTRRRRDGFGDGVVVLLVMANQRCHRAGVDKPAVPGRRRCPDSVVGSTGIDVPGQPCLSPGHSNSAHQLTQRTYKGHSKSANRLTQNTPGHPGVLGARGTHRAGSARPRRRLSRQHRCWQLRCSPPRRRSHRPTSPANQHTSPGVLCELVCRIGVPGDVPRCTRGRKARHPAAWPGCRRSESVCAQPGRDPVGPGSRQRQRAGARRTPPPSPPPQRLARACNTPLVPSVARDFRTAGDFRRFQRFQGARE